MPQIMVEAFAKDLVNKIILEAFDAMDTNKDGNADGEDGLNSQSQFQDNTLELRARTYIDCNGLETREMIQRMVCGFRDLQIGDSPKFSVLEKQVKRATCHIAGSTAAELNETAEIQITQGQGDMHQIMHNAIIETPAGQVGSTITRKERENHGANEATRVSMSLLHRMIEELEKETINPSPENINNPDSASHEGIAAWEEIEEKFIRTIENVEDPALNISEISADINSRCLISERDGLKSSSPLCSTSSLKNVQLDEVENIPSLFRTPNDGPAVTSDTLPDDIIQEDPSSSKMKSKKSKSFGSRMRKFFCTAFGRRQN